MHLLEIITDKARMQPSPMPLDGKGFTPAEVESAALMEIYGSDYSEPGPDYCVFVLVDSSGRKIAERRIAGY